MCFGIHQLCFMNPELCCVPVVYWDLAVLYQLCSWGVHTQISLSLNKVGYHDPVSECLWQASSPGEGPKLKSAPWQYDNTVFLSRQSASPQGSFHYLICATFLCMHLVSLHPAWAICVQHNIADTMKCIISRRTQNHEKQQIKWNRRRLQLPIWLANWLDHVCCIFRDRFCRQLFRSLCFCQAISVAKFILLFGSLKSFMKTEKKLISRSSTPHR